ncbi:MAG: SufS family cysteine desulfurase [Acidimicrobiales bacterium]|jgi:cysteine desulfurase/selenocysteine lyase|nr:SufS family cysteine desulfurase [Acidimicrobiales bacterium]
MALTVTDPLDTAAVKADFPLLARDVDGIPIVYLDSAASSQKPTVVIETMDTYYRTINANVHRGVYRIAEEATNAMEGARAKVARFIGAASPSEVVFTKNATESLNLVAQAWGRANLTEGDVVVLTHMEHHANIVPWQMLAAEKGVELRWIPLDEQGRLDLTDLDALLTDAKVLAVTAMSNVLGTINPVALLTDAARRAGALSVVDACQSVPHLPTDVAAMGADVVAFSGHKMLGPTGVGVLWGREALLDEMPPFLGGGEMIRDVRLDGFTTNDLPWKFEAGTPPIAEIIGLGAAVDYLEALGMEAVRAHELALTHYALDAFATRFGDDLVVHGPSDPSERGGVFSFAYRDLHPHDVSQVLDQHAVCVRAGHHCAKPLMRLLGVGATARASVYVYNDTADIDALCDALDATGSFFTI